jgi:group I intron endonuclease
MANTPSKEVTEFLSEKNLKVKEIYETLRGFSTRKLLKDNLDKKSGIYLILNKISGDYYIGSASTSRFYIRFANHLIHGTGSKIVKAAVKKYGLNAFAFIVLEIYSPAGGEPVDRVTNRGLLDLEDFYLKTLLPNYNILTEAGSSFGYTHTNITRIKMATSYSEERRNVIGTLNRGKSMPLDIRAKLRIAKLGKPNPFTERGYAVLCKKVKITNLDSTIWGLFESITAAAKSLNCDRKTVRIAIKKNTNLLKKYKAYYI